MSPDRVTSTRLPSGDRRGPRTALAGCSRACLRACRRDSSRRASSTRCPWRYRRACLRRTRCSSTRRRHTPTARRMPWTRGTAPPIGCSRSASKRTPIESVSQRIHHVTCRQVAGIAAAVCDDGSLVRGQFLDDDLRLVPTIRPGLAGDAEQHGAPARQQLGAVDLLAVPGRNDHFRCAAIGRHAHDAGRLTEEDRVVSRPAPAEGQRRGAQVHRCTAADRHFLELSRASEIGHPLAVGRQDRRIRNLFRPGDEPRLQVADRAPIQTGCSSDRRMSCHRGRSQ